MLVAREWVSSYNGVWTTDPGDYYLKEENGYFQKSPAMVTKELSNLSDDKGYYRFHITSLILTNPENTPDNFEHSALLQFEKQPEPITSIDRTEEESVPKPPCHSSPTTDRSILGFSAITFDRPYTPTKNGVKKKSIQKLVILA